MKRTTICKTCGKEISKDARRCPNCGAVQPIATAMAVAAIVIVMLTVLWILIIFNLGLDTPTAVGGSNHAMDDEYVGAPIFGVRETAELYDIKATWLNVYSTYGNEYVKASNGKTFVVCEFEIENGSGYDLSINPAWSFDAYIDDYAVDVDFVLLSVDEKKQLSGTIAPGKKMRGSIAYEVDEDWETVELQYSPSTWSDGKIIFSHTKSVKDN